MSKNSLRSIAWSPLVSLLCADSCRHCTACVGLPACSGSRITGLEFHFRTASINSFRLIFPLRLLSIRSNRVFPTRWSCCETVRLPSPASRYAPPPAAAPAAGPMPPWARRWAMRSTTTPAHWDSAAGRARNQSSIACCPLNPAASATMFIASPRRMWLSPSTRRSSARCRIRAIAGSTTALPPADWGSWITGFRFQLSMARVNSARLIFPLPLASMALNRFPICWDSDAAAVGPLCRP
mmetsp:Transcript_16787/g.35493  ORF Transcript_16787/g.35493 Transcript_16787/m.35493 type:complete len:239 (+) Transcript_16787:413-1129(+)